MSSPRVAEPCPTGAELVRQPAADDLSFFRNDEPKNGHARPRIDVNPTDRDQDAKLERLLATGAKLVDIGQAAEASWHVLADPEDNDFCLLKRSIDPL